MEINQSADSGKFARQFRVAKGEVADFVWILLQVGAAGAFLAGGLALGWYGVQALLR